MTSDVVPFPRGDKSSLSPRARWLIGGLIVALTFGAMAYLQIFTVIDRGYSNAFTAIAFGVFLVAMGAWIVMLAPISHRAKWWSIAVPAAIIATLFALLRIDRTSSDLIPKFALRWSKTADERLAESKLIPKFVIQGFDQPDAKLTTPQPAGRTKALEPTPHDFPGFLGPNRDAYVPNVKLATDWEQQPPKLLWKQPIGAGWSAFAVVGDLAFTLEQRGEEELVTCYDVRTGELQWYDAIKARHRNRVGGDGPSSTPEVRDGRVYAQGGTGVLRCLDAVTGKKLWQRDVLADVGTDYETSSTFVHWGRAASPLVIDNLVVIPGGGVDGKQKHSLIAYNKQDGEIVWRGGNRQVSYSSPSIAHYGGVRQIVIVNESNISAHDPETGAELWETKWDGSSSTSASASQTVPLGDDRFFVSKGYSMGGGAVFSITRDDGNWTAKKLWHNRRVLMTKENNVVIKDGYIYGPADGMLQCADLEKGRKQWEGGERVMQVLRVGDVLLVVCETGKVTLVAFDPENYRELASFQALEGQTWNNPALAGKYLLVRNGEQAACYELPLAD
jgi:outer membrane protein assembly factor BamB